MHYALYSIILIHAVEIRARSDSVIVVLMQELEKQTLDYSCAMDAMQLSLDEIRRKSSEKDSKLEQLRATVDQYQHLEVSGVTWRQHLLIINPACLFCTFDGCLR